MPKGHGGRKLLKYYKRRHLHFEKFSVSPTRSAENCAWMDGTEVYT